MTGRNYDYILQVNNTLNFKSSNLIIGANTKTVGLIVNVDSQASTIKVKLSNVLQEFQLGEPVYNNVSLYITSSNSITYSNTTATIQNGNSYIINGQTNTFPIPTVGNTSGLSRQHITVYQNNVKLSSAFWKYPADNVLGSQAITIVPLIFNPATDNNLAYAGFFPGLTGLLNSAPQVIGTEEILVEAVRGRIFEFFDETGSVSYYFDEEISPEYTYVREKYGYIAPPDLINFYNPSGNTNSFVLKMPTYNTSVLMINVDFASTDVAPFVPTYKYGEQTVGQAVISAISYSPFIKEKNAFEQNPLVRLYTIYYPGELYPPKDSGNPDDQYSETAWPWPTGFPYRFAEVRGDYISDINYKVVFDGLTYQPYPINSTGIQLDSSGKINDLTIYLSNFDALITDLVENPYLFGYNSSNNSSGIVNGETVFNIDPRTNPSNVHFDQSIADLRGGYNVAFDYDTTIGRGETWVRLKNDTRDLLGAVIEIRTTFANFLDCWPEYSVVTHTQGDRLKVRTTAPYRVGDVVHNNCNNMSAAATSIIQIFGDYLIMNNIPIFVTGDNLYIKNPDASPDDYILDNFKVNSLDGLDDVAAKFSLTSWLQYFKLQTPKRKYLKNSCVWVYKGPECQYPTSGSGAIPGDSTSTANGFFTSANETTLDVNQDICSKDLLACTLRRNTVHISSFPSSGAALPT